MHMEPLPTDLAAALPTHLDLRLVVSDMDGSLLDGAGNLPQGLTEVLQAMEAAGVHFAPASGRQLANLHELFGPLIDDAPVISENGTVVADGPEIIYTNTIPTAAVQQAILTTRHLAATGYDVGMVVSTPTCAYMERDDERFLSRVRQFYASRAVVPDLPEIDLSQAVKAATFDFNNVENGSLQAISEAVQGVQVMAAGPNWTDMISHTASKGLALKALQERLGITPAQTAIFGDYLNDLSLYEYAEHSFAMANAHPGIHAAARYTAPANTENGVLRTITELLKRQA